MIDEDKTKEQLLSELAKLRHQVAKSEAVKNDRKRIEATQSEQVLSEGEQKYRSVVDNIGIGVALISPKMEILTLNKQMKKWFPALDETKKQICYRSFNVPPREKICPYCPTSKTLQNGEVYEAITDTPAVDKSINYRIISSPIKDSDGNVIAAIEMVEDITEKKQAKDALQKAYNELELRVKERTVDLVRANEQLTKEIAERKRAEERLQKEIDRANFLLGLYEKAPQLTDKDLYDYVLDKAVRLTDSTIGFFHLVSDDQKSVILTTWNSEALKNCTASYQTHYPIEQAGNWVDCVRLKRSVIYNDFPHSSNQKGLPKGHPPVQRFMSIPVIEGDKVEIIFGVGNKTEEYDEYDVIQIQLVANELHKIIKQRRSEEALRESEARYRAVVEDQTELICRFLPNRKITFVNQAYCRYFRKKYEELIGHTFQPLVPKEDKAMVEKLFASLSPENPVTHQEHRVILPDGEIRWVSRSNRMLLNEKGQLVEFQSVGRDITQRKLMEEALKKSSEKIKLFAYSVSHDLKSPAIALYGLTKLLHKQYLDILDEKGKTYCEQIMKASEQIAALVEKINEYIVTRELSPTIENVKLKETLQMVKEDFSSQLNIRQIRWDEPENLPEIKVDRISLLRVFRNFIDNSLKYGGDDLTEIKIGYKESDEFHIFSVKDDGVGIKREASEKIFGLFKRYETSKGIEGAGLGLAIVKEIVEQHGGKVWMESGWKKGVTFFFSISKNLT